MKVKTRPRKAPDALTSFLFRLLHEQLRRSLSFLRYTSRCLSFSHCRHSRLLFFSLPFSLASVLNLDLLYSFHLCVIFTYASQSFLLFSLPVISSYQIFSYCSQIEREGRNEEVETCVSLCVDQSTPLSIYLFLASLLCSIMFLCSSIKMLQNDVTLLTDCE